MGYGDYGCATEECPAREYIIIVGVEDTWNSPGNKLMFMAQAVRYVRRWSGKFDLTTVFYFKGDASLGMTTAQCSAFETAVNGYGGKTQQVSSWADIAAHVNKKTAIINGTSKEKRVQVMIFFAHGTPGKIWLSAKEGLYLETPGIAKIDASSFAEDTGSKYRHVTAWSCQTGNAGKVTLNPEQNMANSLAQAMSDMWDIDVYASPTKTDYSDTWGGGIGGLLDDLTGHRELLDGAVWEPSGADGSVFSTETSHPSGMPEGMHRFEPEQTSKYSSFPLD